MKTLQGKTAVITGAGSGIGRAIALTLAEAGTRIVVSDIVAEAAAAVASEVRERGVEALSVVTNVADHASVEALAEAAYDKFGAVDILCNNAGVSWRPFRTILEANMADWQFLFGVNLWGVIHGLDVFLPRMRQQSGEKHIVNTASISALVPLAGHLPYSASKAAVASISEAAAEELAPEGFCVTILCPGFVKTNITQNGDALRPADERSTMRTFTPYENPLLKTLAMNPMEPDDVGRMVRQAILDGTLYVHTQPLPPAIVERRITTLFGAATRGIA
ncbi:SDR family NAD(P)-dependent oxidoreductase [Paraburkholderia panacisoli]|uniref:SDR family NAD(P)-dependent oxidoreductase n=1 Tax=Paraburkholderia panacisoli TaxID=2603818 RepID=A0A5B0GMM6_9BURK|nr:SDR family NAD(P)-dependent oxidoreductase [Paraburkholderia panacisoli]KAA1004075.1 SDR family NAD(P)-dependent oxidoreductase [Paraburkholderia panacisoli]